LSSILDKISFKLVKEIFFLQLLNKSWKRCWKSEIFIVAVCM